jgi:regulator of protease activity HflC (stomatin/prohibitin superfamily)
VSKDLGTGTSQANGLKVKQLVLSLFVGGVVTAIAFLLGWWWPATLLLLLTLYFACRAFPASLAPIVYSLYAGFAVFWLGGSLLDEVLRVPERGPTLSRLVMPYLVGLVLAILLIILFWQLVILASARWVLAVSDSLGVLEKEARQLVGSQVFASSRNYLIVENGEIVSEKPPGLLARLGGPGVLVMRPGNAVVLERGGATTRIVGPGVHKLQRFETVKRPHQGKGIIDLRPQEGNATANALTKDGIPLDLHVHQGWQIEPKQVTDSRRSSQLAGGEATTPVLGAPEYPVYEATVRKAVFATPPEGWESLFPEGALNVLRDVVATYTLDEIFSLEDSTAPRPDRRVVRRIEEQVVERYDPSEFGVAYRSLDIRHIDVPEDVREQMVRRWKQAQEWKLRVQEAIAEREALIRLSEGRAQALGNVEEAKLSARTNMARMVSGILDTLVKIDKEPVALSFANLVHELTERIGEDEQVAMRYIEAVQAVIDSPGTKSFLVSPAYRGGAASPPPAVPPQGGPGGGRGPEDEGRAPPPGTGS